MPPKLGYDDALDTFGIHGVSGTVGALGTGIVCSAALGGAPDGWDMGTSSMCSLRSAPPSPGAGTAVAIYVPMLTGLRVSPDVEREGLDLGEHGERAYNL